MAAVQGWSRWYDDAPTHPKFLAAGHRAGWLYVCGQAYSSTHATDGLIPKAIVPRLTDVPQPAKHAAKLVQVGLWHDRGDHYEQHDYTEMQSTAAEREERRNVKRSAGTQGNHVRWHVDRGTTDPECPWCPSQDPPSRDRTSIASAIPDGSHPASPEAETEKEVQNHGDAPLSPSDPLDGFEAFWDAYPRHASNHKPGGGGARKVAEKSWRRLKPQQREACLVAVEHYRRWCESPRGEFPKHASTWLNAEAWEDWQTPIQDVARHPRPGPPNLPPDDDLRDDGTMRGVM